MKACTDLLRLWGVMLSLTSWKPAHICWGCEGWCCHLLHESLHIFVEVVRLSLTSWKPAHICWGCEGWCCHLLHESLHIFVEVVRVDVVTYFMKACTYLLRLWGLILERSEFWKEASTVLSSSLFSAFSNCGNTHVRVSAWGSWAMGRGGGGGGWLGL